MMASEGGGRAKSESTKQECWSNLRPAVPSDKAGDGEKEPEGDMTVDSGVESENGEPDKQTEVDR